VIVQHVLASHPSLLAAILDRRTPLCVREAQDGDRLAAGTVLTAPPGRHLLVRADHTLALSSGELVNHVRPSADVLLASVAAHFGAGAIAVILSGTGVDGSAGVRAIRASGGVVLAQDEESAEFPGMPSAAIRTDCVDQVLALESIAKALVGLVHGTAA
jgi:two-component system chemotaxis response regulator CheB